MNDALTRLDELIDKERIIEAGLSEFIRVGEALAYIRDNGLYKAAEHPTFAAYCATRWDFSKGRAYQLIAAAEVSHNLLDAGLTPAPSERTVRGLAQFTDEQQRVIWTIAEKSAVDGKVTTRHINALVEVAKQALTTGAIDPGNGESVLMAKAFEAAVIGEEYENLLRQRQYISNSQKGVRLYSGNAAVVSQDGAAVMLRLEGKPFEAAAGQVVRLTVYTTE